MKRYCLKPKAKAQLVDNLVGVLVVITFVLFIEGLVATPLSVIVAPSNTAEIFMSYIGILSWTAVFSFIAIGIKRWLQSNIVEC